MDSVLISLLIFFTRPWSTLPGPHSINKLILSEVDCVIEGDIYYPEICFDEWNQLSSKKFKKDESNEYNFVVKIYEKIVN